MYLLFAHRQTDDYMKVSSKQHIDTFIDDDIIFCLLDIAKAISASTLATAYK